VGLALLATGPLAGLAAAAPPVDSLDRLAADATAEIAPWAAAHPEVAVVVAAYAGGRTRVLGFGRGPGGAAPGADTLFEVGSLTKVFTGLMLADLVVRGRARLDEPVEKVLPPGPPVARLPGERAITLLDLVTHTSGLPWMPEDFIRQKDLRDPVAAYTVGHLRRWLAGVRLRSRPGTTWLYSNAGHGVLGQALAAREADRLRPVDPLRGYEALLGDRIGGPLGLRSTRVVLQPGEAARLATGHDETGEPTVARVGFSTLAACCGLRSTAADLLRFMAAQLVPSSAPQLAAALELSQRPQRPIGARPGEQMALGWLLKDGSLWHRGEMQGFTAYLKIDRAAQRGLVVLAAANFAPIAGWGEGLEGSLAGRAFTPSRWSRTLRLESAAAKRFPLPYGHGMTLRWTPHPGAFFYSVEFSTDGGITWASVHARREAHHGGWINHHGTLSCAGGPAGETARQCLPPGRTFHYRVRALDGNGMPLGPWSPSLAGTTAHWTR
jgi:CubicO group peptidase (beta-lactamase class C family)